METVSRTVIRTGVKEFTQRYISYNHEGKRIHLPLVYVRLFGKNATFRSPALVDSGATTSFIPTDLAEALELPDMGVSDATGAGGKFPTRVTECEIAVLKQKEIVSILNAKHIHIPKERGRIPFVVLGRDTIFQKYDIIFRENTMKVIFRRPKEK